MRRSSRSQLVGQAALLLSLVAVLGSCVFDGSGLGWPAGHDRGGDRGGEQLLPIGDGALELMPPPPDGPGPGEGPRSDGEPTADQALLDLGAGESRPSCDKLYGDAPGYWLCGTPAGLCSFYVDYQQKKGSCSQICGNRCQAAFLVDASQDRCQPLGQQGCAAKAGDRICLCTR